MKIIHFYLKLLIPALLVLTSCAMRTVTINTIRPADINVPSHIDTLVLLNRTYFSSQAINVLEGVLTGELPGEDKAATQEALNSLQSTLSLSNRYVLKNAAEIFPGNSLTAAFPNPLSWGDIDGLCAKYNANAVVAIEIFDSDFIVTDGKRQEKKEVTENGVKRNVDSTVYFAKGIANITMGMRIYDPRNKTIIDQQLVSRTNTWETTGNSIQDALYKLVSKSYATRYVGSMAGADYAYKIAPMPVTLSRAYYKKAKGAPLSTTATRQAQVNDWAGAMETWKKSLAQANNNKQVGRICYNIAVACEVMGDLNQAKVWANKAYVNYGNSKAKRYVTTLDTRIYDQNRVQQQMQ